MRRSNPNQLVLGSLLTLFVILQYNCVTNGQTIGETLRNGHGSGTGPPPPEVGRNKSLQHDLLPMGAGEGEAEFTNKQLDFPESPRRGWADEGKSSDRKTKPEGTFESDELDSSSSPSGIASWIIVTCAVSVTLLFFLSFGLTLMIRRRQAITRRECSKPAEEGSGNPSMYNTVQSNSTDRSTHRSKSTVSTYMSNDSSGPEPETIELLQVSDRHRPSVQNVFPDDDRARNRSCAERNYLNEDPDPPISSASLPRVKVVNQTQVVAQQEASGPNFLLRACIGGGGMEDTPQGSLLGISNLCHQDDGNKLRGGNGEFARRYVDVDYMNTDLPSKRRLGPQRYWKPQANTRNRNESNTSSSTVSHHSARSFISIPPTSPSEKYVEAGSDDWSLRSQRSSPPCVTEWLTKSTRTDPRNELSTYQSTAHTQTEPSPDLSTHTKTVFGTPWQFGGTFTSRGGVMQAKDSDVSLTVVANAIPKGEYVDLYGAVFTDTTEIRKKFTFPLEEYLITPVVEYHSANKASFKKHVSIHLPHSLADDFDVSSIKVYTFNVSERGQVRLECVPPLTRNHDTRADSFWEKGQDGTTVHISTTHFSGYFCTLCEAKSLPSICTMVFGSHVQMGPARREVRVILYVWDRRLTIKDYLERFRKQESDVDRQLLTDMQIPLLDDASSNSRLLMRMETMGESVDRQCWQHIARPNTSRPLFKPLQVRKLSEIVHCCRQTDPIRVEWALENVPQQVPSAIFQCCIDIMHVPESTIDYEAALREDNDDLMRTFYVRDLKVTPTNPPKELTKEPSQEFVRVDLKRTLSELMNVEQTENLCKEYGLASKDIGNFRKKYSSDNDIQAGLVEECLKRYGPDKFLKELPEVLQKLSLTSVLHHLEDQKIVVNDLTDFTGLSNPSLGGHSGMAKQENTRRKSPQRQSAVRQFANRRRQSVSPPPHGQASLQGDLASPTRRHYPENTGGLSSDRGNRDVHSNRLSDDVFVRPGHDSAPGTRHSGRSQRSRRSPPSPDYPDEEDPCNGYSRPQQSRYNGPHEECQPLNPNKSSSSGSDSVLRGGSLNSPEGACAPPNFPSASTEGYSLLAQADTMDFREPYGSEVLDSILQETHPKELASCGGRTGNVFSDPSAYPEIAEEQCFSNSGPQAIPPSHSPGGHATSSTDSNRYRQQSPSSEQTSIKELYGVHTVV